MGEIVKAVSILAGGVGIFLIGMAMMTDGLKLAAGPALERILAGATRTRWQAFASGVLVTAITQSSSVVTIATIGFVNAGLLKLGGALWLMFGANLGSTMMGWIVAVIGLKFNIDAFALPMIAVGVATRLTGAGTRRGAIGNALAGFGLLFFGISLLQSIFHTTFNVLGVLLMIPLATPLLHWLQRRFRTREEGEGAPQFLDDNVRQVPQLAVDALKREVERLGVMSRHMVRGALAGTCPGVLAQEHASVMRLGSVCQSFAERMNRVAGSLLPCFMRPASIP
ncbi:MULTISPECIES: Na/Pi symporter [Pandoraea]|uniref:Na/Pi cotransporter family protein n=1 Tax=Pandoraea TaxID=93217 RepID=UPI001F5C6C6E|nr:MULTISPECIES: Na/Pi symporter [Pandoraea]MCI3205354.1 hypothetical protein [Pandoraea sp. LA3]MDN4583382.1 hypothetical protein [Pandoraea capi]